MKARLYKTNVGGEALRTNTVEGVADRIPTVGQCFEIFVENGGLEFGHRAVNTSPVKRFIKRTENSWKFETRSGSIYTVERIS